MTVSGKGWTGEQSDREAARAAGGWWEDPVGAPSRTGNSGSDGRACSNGQAPVMDPRERAGDYLKEAGAGSRTGGEALAVSVLLVHRWPASCKIPSHALPSVYIPYHYIPC